MRERHREHDAAFRAMLVEQAGQDGVRERDGPRRHGICSGLIHRWRRAASPQAGAGSAVQLAPVRLADPRAAVFAVTLVKATTLSRERSKHHGEPAHHFGPLAGAIFDGRIIGPVITGRHIICLGTVEWLVVRSVAEYTMLGLARENTVLFVEPFGSWITQARVRRWQNRRRERTPRLRQAAPTLWVYRPPAIGLPGASRMRWVADLNGFVLALLLRRVQRQMGLRDTIVWSFLYDAGALLRSLPARLRIYECADYDAALARDERQRRRVWAHEAATCRAADLVFAVTEELACALRPHNHAVHVVNCAAALEVFGRALLPQTAVPDDIAALPRPVLGYMGGVDPWKIDVGLLVAMATAHPEWSIALVGYVWFGFDPAALGACPNVHILGPKDYEAIPGYLKGMDVCIMPFPLNDITRNGDALKLYEYLAAGRPVVSTPVPASRRLGPAVAVADTPEAFIAAAQAALSDTPEKQAQRLAAIRPHSWDARIEQKSVLIEAALARERPV